MEQNVNQQEITEELPSADISTEETKVSETKEQDINRIVQSEIDKRLAPIYRERDTYKRENETLQKQQDELENDISRMQDEAYKDDPELLKDAKSKRQFVKEKRDFERKQREFENAQVVLGQQMKALDVAEISAKYGVKPSVLERADVQNKQELEDFAREITGELKGKETSKDSPPYDRGVSDAPSGKHFTADSIAAMSPEEYKENEAAIEKAWREGRIK